MRKCFALLRIGAGPGILLGAFLASSAGAQDADFVGKIHESDLKIPGWESRGGGLLREPVWYHVFRRADGAYRIVINLSLGYKPGSKHMTFRITDVATTGPMPKDTEFASVCRTRASKATGSIVAVVRADMKREQEWWSDVRRAWTVSPQGKLAEVATRGISCLNEAGS
jgi:hypothetical protein